MTSKSQIKRVRVQTNPDYKALAIKFAKLTYDVYTGYSFKLGSEEVDKSHCLECGAKVDGGARMKLIHEDDCVVKEIQDFLAHHLPVSPRK